MLKHFLFTSDSDEVTFGELQDVLTYFIKYENRHQMRNTLAMIDPVSCQVTQVVADNVKLDRSDEDSILNEEDFISSYEAERGQKLPVYVDHESMRVKYSLCGVRGSGVLNMRTDPFFVVVY